MIKKIISICFLIGAVCSAYSYAQNPNSAYRSPHQNWRDIPQKRLNPSLGEGPSIVENAIAWNFSTIDQQQKLLTTIPVWPNYETIKKQFQYLKNKHFLIDPIDISLKRTIPWRYPVDYCFERAATAVELYDNAILPRPAKVFAFGNLVMLSPYAEGSEGLLWFWYHVAPLVRDRETQIVYVLDPALNYKEPLPLERWLKQLVELSDQRELKVNICNGYGSVPFDVCSTTSAADEKSIAAGIVNKLPSEWEHLQSKGINSQQVLLGNHLKTEAGRIIYGAIALHMADVDSNIKSQLLIQYKLSGDTTWKNLLDVNNAVQKMKKFNYFRSHPVIPIGTVFAKSNRSEDCQCNYQSCRCALPNSASKMDLQIILNGTAIKQCTYQYPNDTNLINQAFVGPDIHYQFEVNTEGEIDASKVIGSIDGCV